MYFSVLQSSKKKNPIQIKITNYYFYLLSSAHTISTGSSYTRASCAHICSSIQTRIAPYRTAPFGAMRYEPVHAQVCSRPNGNFGGNLQKGKNFFEILDKLYAKFEQFSSKILPRS